MSAALCLILTLTLLPIGALAEEGGGDPGGGDSGEESYTITLNVGENGSVTVEIAGEPVAPDEAGGNTYTVPAGSDVTFAFEPNEGYIIDELWVGDHPERTNPDYTFRIDNLRNDVEITVTFIEPEDYTITVPQVEHVTIRIEKNGGTVNIDGNPFTFSSQTRDMVRYYFTLDPGYTLKDFNIWREGEPPEGVFVDYDPDDGVLYADVETNFSYTLVVETEELNALPVHYFAIVSGEAGNEDDMKAAIRRELGLQRVIVSEDIIAIYDGTAPATAPGVGYKKVTVGALGDAHFYIVDNAKTLLILTEPEGGDKALTVYDGSAVGDIAPVTIKIPAIARGEIYAFGPYGAFAMDMSRAIGLDLLPVSAGENGAYNVTDVFSYMQWHVINNGTSPDTRINWYPANIVTADAVYIEALATKGGVTQGAGAWAIDTSPRINRVDEDGALHYRLEIFFGNDTVTISPPAEGNVTGVTVRGPSDSPGYTFTNNSGSVIVTFYSDYYDYVTVPLTLTLGENGTIDANVTIHRVGVDIQEHRYERSNEGMSRIWHGTEPGNVVDLSDEGFKLTATYYIPDSPDSPDGPDDGNNAPYGLFVTRKFSDGRVETATILASMEGVFDHGEAASAVDYIIYSGTSRASAPVSVSVLVLKDEPDEDAFGGVTFGSGTGVTWTKQ